MSNFSNNKPSTYINTAVMFIIFGAFYVLSPVDPLTDIGMKVLGVFFAVLYGWMFIDLVFPSLLGLLALGFTGYAGVGEVLTSAFGNSTVILLTLFCALTSILSASGVAEYITVKLFSLKITQGRPYVGFFIILLITIIISLFLTATATILLMIPLIYEVSKKYGYQPGEKWPMMLLIGSNYIVSMSCSLLPFHAGPQLVYNMYFSLNGDPDGTMNTAAYLVCALLLLIVSVATTLLAIKFIARPDVERIKSSEAFSSSENMTLNGYQKYVLYSFAILLVLLLWPSIMPSEWVFTKFLNQLSTSGILAAFIAIYLLLNFKKGLKFKAVMSRDVPWHVIYLVAAALTIAAAFADESTGISEYISLKMLPILSELNIYACVFIIILIGIILTNVGNNTAIKTLLVPIAYTLVVGVEMDDSINMQALMFCLHYATAMGLCTPIASANTAIVFGETEWTSTKTLMTWGLFFCIAHYVYLLAIGYGLGSILF